MALWTDIIDPATLTGYARAALADYEASKGTLARWLPNRFVPSIEARFVKGATGLVDVAKFRAYDAEPKLGTRASGQRATLEPPALGQNIPATEYEQLRAAGATPSEAQALVSIQTTTRTVVRAVADAQERMRGIVLTTGKATIAELATDDDFGRAGGHTVNAAALWSIAATDALAELQTWVDTYTDANGEAPGAILTSRRVVRALGTLNQFKTQLVSGSSRPATADQVNDTLTANGLPPIYQYDRRVSVDGSTTRVIADDKLLLLPAPVEIDDWEGTELGATFWGRTLTSMEPDWDIADVDRPGIVTGVYRNEKPPMIAEVLADAIGMPVLANANLSFAADVL